jgi:hypothetical protein
MAFANAKRRLLCLVQGADWVAPHTIRTAQARPLQEHLERYRQIHGPTQWPYQESSNARSAGSIEWRVDSGQAVSYFLVNSCREQFSRAGTEIDQHDQSLSFFPRGLIRSMLGT